MIDGKRWQNEVKTSDVRRARYHADQRENYLKTVKAFSLSAEASKQAVFLY